MKISNKIFAVVSAALLLASCNNNFTPTDYANQDTKPYYGEEYSSGSNKPWNSGTIGNFKVSSVAATPTLKEDGSADVEVTFNFTDSVDASTISGVKILKKVDASDEKTVISLEDVTSKAEVAPENTKVKVNFTAEKGTSYVLKVESTVKSLSGRALDQDGDGIAGEATDDICMRNINTFTSGALKGIDWLPAGSSGAQKLEIPSISQDFDSNGNLKSLVISMSEQEGLYPENYAAILSSHVVLCVTDAETDAVTEKALTFEAKTELGWTTFKAEYPVDLSKDDSAYLAIKDIDTFKATVGGVEVRYTTDDKKKAKNDYVTWTKQDINPWNELGVQCDVTTQKYRVTNTVWNHVSTTNSTEITGYSFTIGNAETKVDFENSDYWTDPYWENDQEYMDYITKTKTGEGSLPATAKSLKIVLTDLVDADKDGKPATLEAFYKDGDDYVSMGELQEDSLYKNKKAYSTTYPIPEGDASKINGNIYIKGEDGDTCTVQVFYKTN